MGALLLSALFLYGGGSFLVLSSVGDDTAVPENAASLAQLCAGSALLLLNSAAVITIGALAFRVLRREHRGTANAYLGTRIAEAVLLALAPLGTLMLALFGSRKSGLARTLVENAETAYLIAMATLGVGSIFFCWVLLKSGLLPRILAACGIAGYAIFALGSVLELSGYGVGLVMSIPGGLFEVAAGFYLLVKGFRSLMPDGSVPPHDTRPTTLQVNPAVADEHATLGHAMSTTKIRNVHERRIAADPEVVWDLLIVMSGPSGRLWPPGIPTMRFDRPLAIGAHGRHGPIHYKVTSLDPTAGNVVFGFREPTGLVGHHSFHVRPDENAGAVLRHEVIANPEGWMRLKWPLTVRWVHDAVVEEVLDRAEVATGTVPAQPYQRSLWVRALLAVGAKTSRAVRAPRAHHAAARA